MDTFFDTHCHLTRHEFDADRSAVIRRADQAHVRMLCVGIDRETSQACLDLARTHDGVYAALGVHPNDIGSPGAEDLSWIRDLAAHPKVIALGETGLDYYWKRTSPSEQKDALQAHLSLAEELHLPVVLHARQSEDDLLDTVTPFFKQGVEGVWHCFLSNKKEMARRLHRALDIGLYIGLGGMVTFPDQLPLQNIVPDIPDRRLLLETDAPFLAPHPRPGNSKRNEPARVVRVAERIAELRGVSLSDIARITSRNAERLFGLPPEGGKETESDKIAYVIRNALYLNLTNECNNSCRFCARNHSFVVKGHDIELAHDPSVQEILEAMGDVRGYDEVVFCGFGEPTLRLDVLCSVARSIKEQGQTVRLNTNGLANLEHERNIVPELVGLVDTVSVSLNTADPCQYHRLCNPRFGHISYQGVCEFVEACVAAGLPTTCTVVDLPEIDVDAAREKSAELGAAFRVRSHVDVG